MLQVQPKKKGGGDWAWATVQEVARKEKRLGGGEQWGWG